jgi:hypothetical protein
MCLSNLPTLTSYSALKATGRSPQKKLGRPDAATRTQMCMHQRTAGSYAAWALRIFANSLLIMAHATAPERQCNLAALPQPPGGLALGCACTKHTLQLCNCDLYQREGLQVRARGRATLGLGARTPAKAALALAQHQLPIVHTISTNERKARVRGCLCAELIVACWPLQSREPASMPAPSPHRTE